MVNNFFKDPSKIERILNNPIVRTKIQNNSFLKLAFQNPQLITNNFCLLKMAQNIFKENKRNQLILELESPILQIHLKI